MTEIESSTQVQILDETDFSSLRANALGKCMSPAFHQQLWVNNWTLNAF